MHNELMSVGNLTFYGYGLMIALGIIAAYVSAERRAKSHGLKNELIFGLTVTCAITGILGAKLLYIIVDIKNIIADPSILLDISNGFVVYGGIIIGILCGWIYCRKKKLFFLDYFDIGMPSIALAQAFGRIGCFLAGCCYGRPTDSWIGITFTNEKYQVLRFFSPDLDSWVGFSENKQDSYIQRNLVGVPVIPTQLISSALDLLNFLVLVLYARKKRASGRVASLYLVFYSAGRFVIEFFRSDIDRGTVGALSTSQFISIFTFAIGIAMYFIFGALDTRRSFKEAEAAQAAEDVRTETDVKNGTDTDAETDAQNGMDTDAETDAQDAEDRINATDEQDEPSSDEKEE